MSPYSYCNNDPVNNIDPDGRDAKVSLEENHILIEADIYIYGNLASVEMAKKIQDEIMNSWNETNKASVDGKEVSFAVNVRYLGKQAIEADFDSNDKKSNYMEIVGNGVRGYVKDSNRGVFNVRSAAHEFGHMIGLMDRYDKKTFVPEDGYEGTIMAEPCQMGFVVPEDIQRSVYLAYPKNLTPQYSIQYIGRMPLMYYVNTLNCEKNINCRIPLNLNY